MTFALFIETFWPLLMLYASPLLAVIVLAWMLSRNQRRRDVRRFYRMRRA